MPAQKELSKGGRKKPVICSTVLEPGLVKNPGFFRKTQPGRVFLKKKTGFIGENAGFMGKMRVFLQFTSFIYIFYFLIDSLPLLFKSSNISMPSVSFVFQLSTYNP